MLHLYYWIIGNKLQWNMNQNTLLLIQENAYKNVICEMGDISFSFQCTNSLCLQRFSPLKHLILVTCVEDLISMISWWRHKMETFSALLAICVGNSPVPGEFPAQRPVTRSFDVFFDLRLNKRLSKQSWGWWFEMLSCPLWHHCNVITCCLNTGVYWIADVSCGNFKPTKLYIKCHSSHGFYSVNTVSMS